MQKFVSRKSFNPNIMMPILRYSVLCAVLAFSGPLADALPTAKEFREGAMRNPHLHESTGEQFCWNSRIAIGDILQGYKGTNDTAWLDEAITYFDFLESKLLKDPDGYPGWIGAGIYDKVKTGEQPEFIRDALVGDAILLEEFVSFSEIVHNNPTLKEKYGSQAEKYLELARLIGWEKWNKRGTYYRDAAGYGSYHTHPKVINRTTGQWKDETAMVSDNLNKHSAMASVIMRMYRITGNEEYRVRAFEIFARLKNMFRHFPDDDRVSWNFWMPHGPYDVNGIRVSSWIGVHPNRPGYQATEVSHMVEAYDTGIVFDRADIQRLVNANHYMMPANNSGKWRSSDGSSDAGTLWSSLVRFDPLIKKMYLAKLGENPKSHKDQIALEYFSKVTAKLDESRQLTPANAKVSIYDFPPRPGAKLSATVVIPNRIELANDETTRLVSNIRGGGALTLDLIDKASGKNLGRIHEEEIPSAGTITIPTWDGKIPGTDQKKPGTYLIRWTLDDEVRDELVDAVVGTKREKIALTSFPHGVAKGIAFPAKPLAKGASLEFGFGGNSDSLWILKGAEISTSLPDDRKGAGLQIGQGQSATLAFGNNETALPVRVTMSVYDAGEKFGTKAVDGNAWGLVGNDGEFYGPARFWRKYLGTDANHSWVTTAKSGWMSPGFARIPRSKGWHVWIFDLTHPEAPFLTVDGVKAVFPKGGLPTGAVGITLRGGAEKAPLYVTDVKVEYP